MVFRNFRLQILFRVALLFVLLLGLVLALTGTQWRITPVVIAALVLVSVINLIYYVERTSHTFAEFLNSIYYQDFSTKVPASEAGAPFKRLSAAYKLITDSFRRLAYQKEEHLSLLEAVVDHLKVAIVCVDDGGKVKLFNKAAKNLFRTPHIHHLDGLSRIDSFIHRCVENLAPGEQQLVSANIKGSAVNLSVVNNQFRVADKRYRLMSFHNIRDELEQKESDAWQKLIRVLAHEIMNSATPILSLSSSIKSMLSAEMTLPALSEDDQLDLIRGLDSIESRSKGLIKFVNAYRGLTQIPKPRLATTDLTALVQNVIHLLTPEMIDAGIEVNTHFDAGRLQAKVDREQIEQVLINVIRNGIQALSSRPQPTISLAVKKQTSSKIVIDIDDNGCGVAEDNLANIFMPFYTTKRDGTGIGLSISRQIMFMNRGLLTVESQEGVGSRFRLEFATDNLAVGDL